VQILFGSQGLLAVAVSALIGVAAVDLATAETPRAPAGLAFYSPPSPLPEAAAGTVIWSRRAPAAIAMPSAQRQHLVLYHSRSIDGRDIAVSGTVYIPRGKPPKDGWPLITWTHGTTGLVAACAPSRDTPRGPEHYSLGPSRAMLDVYVRRGYAVAFSDFEGLGGSTAVHPFLQGEAEAHGALDIMRAARQLDPRIGSRYLVMGHSQGGQADLFTAALGPDYAPEFKLLGNVAFAPASQIGDRITDMSKADQPSVALVYAMAFLQGLAANHPQIDLKTLLSPQALAHLDEMKHDCISETLGVSGSRGSGYWPKAVPKDQFLPGADLGPVLLLARANDPDRLKIAAPTLIMQGGRDVTVLPRTNDALARALCQSGNVLSYKVFPAADHEAVVQQGKPEAQAFVKARFAGKPATNNCNALPTAASK
jgi:pimeloyl-ACP methyl ester carboxylesterase